MGNVLFVLGCAVFAILVWHIIEIANAPRKDDE